MSKRFYFWLKVTLAVVIFIGLCILVGKAQAASLVCDPYPVDSQPTYYSMKVDGAPVTTPYGTMVSGASLVLDLNPLDDNKHIISDIKACNDRGCSDPPLVFTVPAIPARPSSIRIGY